MIVTMLNLGIVVKIANEKSLEAILGKDITSLETSRHTTKNEIRDERKSLYRHMISSGIILTDASHNIPGTGLGCKIVGDSTTGGINLDIPSSLANVILVSPPTERGALNSTILGSRLAAPDLQDRATMKTLDSLPSLRVCPRMLSTMRSAISAVTSAVLDEARRIALMGPVLLSPCDPATIGMILDAKPVWLQHVERLEPKDDADMMSNSFCVRREGFFEPAATWLGARTCSVVTFGKDATTIATPCAKLTGPFLITIKDKSGKRHRAEATVVHMMTTAETSFEKLRSAVGKSSLFSVRAHPGYWKATIERHIIYPSNWVVESAKAKIKSDDEGESDIPF